MRLFRRLIAAAANRLPDPDQPPGRNHPLDPRIDPDALDRFGREELTDFGMARSHGGPGQAAAGRGGDSTNALERSLVAKEEQRERRLRRLRR